MKTMLMAVAFLELAAFQIVGQEVVIMVGPGGQRMISQDGIQWKNHASWGEPKHDQNDLNVATFFKGSV